MSNGRGLDSTVIIEIIDIKTDRQTHRLTDRHIHADENNTCPKTKFLGQVTKLKTFVD